MSEHYMSPGREELWDLHRHMLQICGGMQQNGDLGEVVNADAYLLASDAFLNMYNGMDAAEAVSAYEREFKELAAEHADDPLFDASLGETIVGAVLEPCLLRNYWGRIENMRGNRLADGRTELQAWEERQGKPEPDHGGALSPRMIDEHMARVRAQDEARRAQAAVQVATAPPPLQAAPSAAGKSRTKSGTD
jgi:hypothetical protein